MPKVSVILTSYNHAKYVAEAVQSVLDQTFQDFELLICDDGSQDRSQEIIRSFQDPRIRLFLSDRNQGASVCVREAVQAAQGAYIAVHHSDDIWEPAKLAKQVAFLDSHSAEYGAVFSYAQIIDDRGALFNQPDHFYSRVFVQENRTRQEWLRHFFYEGNCLCHPSILIRRECYEQLGTYDDRFFQVPDMDFWIRLCLRWEIHVLPEKLVRFRVHFDESNASGGRLENVIRNNNEYLLLLQEFLKIPSEEDFFRIFPEYSYLQSSRGFVLEYALARVCLDRGLRRMYHCLGFFLLYRVMGDAASVQRIREIYGFGFQELYALAQQYDLFSVCPQDLFQPVLYYMGTDGQRVLLPAAAVSLKNGAVHIRVELPAGAGREDVLLQPIMGCPCDFAELQARQDGHEVVIEAETATMFREQIMSAELSPVLRISGESLAAGTLEVSYRVHFLEWGEVMQVYIRRIEELLRRQEEQRQAYNELVRAGEQERQCMQAEQQRLAQEMHQEVLRRENLETILGEIYSSRGYRLLQRLYGARDFFRRKMRRGK